MPPHVSIPRPARWRAGPSALWLVGASAPASQPHVSTPAPSLPPALRPVGAPACQPACAPTRQHASAPASSTPAPQHASAASLSHRRRRHRHHQRAQRCARSKGAPVLAPTRLTLPRRQGKRSRLPPASSPPCLCPGTRTRTVSARPLLPSRGSPTSRRIHLRPPVFAAGARFHLASLRLSTSSGADAASAASRPATAPRLSCS